MVVAAETTGSLPGLDQENSTVETQEERAGAARGLISSGSTPEFGEKVLSPGREELGPPVVEHVEAEARRRPRRAAPTAGFQSLLGGQTWRSPIWQAPKR